jgi:hypothetical protein
VNRVAIISLLFAAPIAAPGLAQASDVRVSSYEMNEAGGTIVLESDVLIGEPWLRLESRSFKIWFPDLIDVARFDHVRDGREAIRSLQLRPGASNSAVLKVDLGVGRQLAREYIQITRDGQRATIHIRLPIPPRPEPLAKTAPMAAPVVTAKPGVVPKPLAAAVPAPTAAATASSGAATSLAAATDPSTSTAVAAVPVAPLAPAAAAKTVASALKNKSGPQLGLAEPSGSNFGMLIAITAVLLGVYGYLRVYNKKKKRAPGRAPEIEVVSARRLGHRQELLVVRALGEDHLLMCSQGRMERVSSVRTPTLLPSELPLAPQSILPTSAAATGEAESQANGLGIITKLSSRSRLRRLLDAVDSEMPPEPEPEMEPAAMPAPAYRPSGRPSFGPELLSAMNQHKMTSLSAMPQVNARQSEAVAGIARLRGRVAN